MRSTGEVMGIDVNFGLAFIKSQLAAGQDLLSSNKSVFLSVNDEEKPSIVNIAKNLKAMNYTVYSTIGTFEYLKNQNIDTILVRKAQEKTANILDLLSEKEISILISLPSGKETLKDNMSIRRMAILMDIPLITTLAGAEATVEALRILEANNGKLEVRSLQEIHMQKHK